jgi:hypothetical protein
VNKNITINFFFPIWLAIAIILGALDIVSWWVIALIVTSQFKIETSFKLK